MFASLPTKTFLDFNEHNLCQSKSFTALSLCEEEQNTDELQQSTIPTIQAGFRSRRPIMSSTTYLIFKQAKRYEKFVFSFTFITCILEFDFVDSDIWDLLWALCHSASTIDLLSIQSFCFVISTIDNKYLLLSKITNELNEDNKLSYLPLRRLPNLASQLSSTFSRHDSTMNDMFMRVKQERMILSRGQFQAYTERLMLQLLMQTWQDTANSLWPSRLLHQAQHFS